MDKIKHIFFDVDGTLVNPRTHQFEASTKQTLQALKQAGYQLYIATGRPFDKLLPEIVEGIQWDGFVLNNGQVVLDHQAQPISITSIDPNIMQEVIDEANRHDIAILIQSKGWQFVTPVNDVVNKVLSELNETAPEVVTYNNEPAYTFMVFGDDVSFLDKFDQFHFAKGQQAYVDVMLKGFNKAVGIQKFAIDHYIAFGDSMNDYEMFKNAKLSVAMNDSAQQLQAVATYVSQTQENEIQTIVKQLKLLEQ